MQLINSIRNRFVIMKGLRMSVVSQYLALIQAYWLLVNISHSGITGFPRWSPFLSITHFILDAANWILMKQQGMMYINFNIASFGLRGTLQHIFDCLHITDNMSDAADQIFTETCGNKASLCSGTFKSELDWSDGGSTSFVYLLLIGPKGGVSPTCLLLPCFDEYMFCGSIKRFCGQVEVFAPTNLTVDIDFPQTSKNKSSLLLLSSACASLLSVCMCGVLRQSQ